MVLVDDVRSYNQLHLRMLVEVFDKQILVRLPGASCHESHRVVLEKLHQRQMFSFLTNLQHTVKTGIAHHRDTTDAYFRQIAFGAFILHKQVVEVTQHMSVGTAIPLEEYLSAAENGGNAVHRNTALVQFVQIVLPELVLDEECHTGIHDIQKLLHIAGLVERQITDDVCPPVILADLIARR